MDLEKFLVSLHVRTRDVGFFCALAQSPQSARLCPPPPPSQLHDSDVTRRIVAVQCSSVVTMLHHQASSWNGPDLASTSRLTLVRKMIPSPWGNQIFVDSLVWIRTPHPHHVLPHLLTPVLITAPPAQHVLCTSKTVSTPRVLMRCIHVPNRSCVLAGPPSL